MSINANTLYYNMASSASSASSSSGKSIAVLIKKAMAKMPMSYNTKKSIDEYYKTAMKAINDKKKAEEKAKKAALKAKEKAVAKPKAVKGSKTAKKPRAKKLVGGTPRIDDLVKLYMNENENLIDTAINEYDNNKDSNAFVRNLSYINLDGEETSVATNIMRLLMSRVLTDEEINSLYKSMKDLKESYNSLKTT